MTTFISDNLKKEIKRYRYYICQQGTVWGTNHSYLAARFLNQEDAYVVDTQHNEWITGTTDGNLSGEIIPEFKLPEKAT
jgi:hypothetical protein